MIRRIYQLRNWNHGKGRKYKEDIKLEMQK